MGLGKTQLYEMKQNPIKYSLRKNDIKQISQNEINYLKNLNNNKNYK